MKAICMSCGVPKAGPLVPCRACGHVPMGDERPVSWLLSDHHLTPPELAVASQRIRSGLLLKPPPALIVETRREMKRVLPGRKRRPAPEQELLDPDDLFQEDWVPDEGADDLNVMDSFGPPGAALSHSSMLLLAIVNLVASPLIGWMIWVWWRVRSPLAARQVLKITVPVTIITSVAWLTFMIVYWRRTLL